MTDRTTHDDPDDPAPNPTNDPFAALGVPRAFPVDRAAVQRAWLAKQAKLHPDRAADPASAAAELAKVNQARAELADDESAAKALLRVLGGPSAADVKDLPDGMLMGMLDIREQMDEAKASGDPAQREELETWAAEQRSEFKHRVIMLFAEAGQTPTAEQLHTIRVQLNGWRYIERMIEQLDERPAL